MEVYKENPKLTTKEYQSLTKLTYNESCKTARSMVESLSSVYSSDCYNSLYGGLHWQLQTSPTDNGHGSNMHCIVNWVVHK